MPSRPGLPARCPPDISSTALNSRRIISHNPPLRQLLCMVLCPLVTLVGSRAMIGYKLRQARKGATVVADSCAAVWLARATFTDPVKETVPLTRFFLSTQYADEDTK